jgi:hypothetical protein
MNLPYGITPKILKLITLILEKIGKVNATFLSLSSPKLGKENRIKTIHIHIWAQPCLNKIARAAIIALK